MTKMKKIERKRGPKPRFSGLVRTSIQIEQAMLDTIDIAINGTRDSRSDIIRLALIEHFQIKGAEPSK